MTNIIDTKGVKTKGIVKGTGLNYLFDMFQQYNPIRFLRSQQKPTKNLLLGQSVVKGPLACAVQLWN